MSKDIDYKVFKSTMKLVADNLRSHCDNPAGIESIFNDVIADAGDLVFSRNKKIADLEKKLKESSKKEGKQNTSSEKPKKECPPGKIINPKTGRCINKPKEKTHKKSGRPNLFVKTEEQKETPKKACPPGKIINPKTGRCINKPKEKTHKNRGRPKKNVAVLK